MPHRRRRRSQKGNTGFDGWGYLLTVALAVALWQQTWAVSGWLALVLLAYMFWFHPTNCRVETLDGGPCTKPVSGWLRGCRGSHRGMKTRTPVAFRSPGHLVPQVMWPRPAPVAAAYSPPPPRSATRRTSTQRSVEAAGSRLMTIVAVASLVVASLSFLRDLVAG